MQALWDKVYPKILNLVNPTEYSNWTATGFTSNCVQTSSDTIISLGTSSTAYNSDTTKKLLTFTRNPIDITYFNELRIIGKVAGYGGTSNPVDVSLKMVSEDGETSITLQNASYSGTVLNVNVTKDISSLTGKYSFQVNVYKTGNWQSRYDFSTFQLL